MLNNPIDQTKKTVSSCIMICMFISLIFHVIMSLVGMASNGSLDSVLFLNTYLLFALIMLYFFAVGINKHFLIFCFFACIFIFLMGQKFFVVLGGGKYNEFLTFRGLELDAKEYSTFINLLYFSLVGCFWGYVCARPAKCETVLFEEVKSSTVAYRTKMRRILRVLYLITFVCAFIMQLQIVLAKRDVSYTEGYLTNVDVNVVIRIGNYLYTGIAFLYLASKPSKKEMFVILFSFLLVQGAMQLLIGRRALLAQVLLFAIWFCICYFKADRKKFTLKHFLFLVLFAVILIVLFYIVEMVRGGKKAGGFSLFEIIEKFFISTGGSDSTIANIIHYQNEFPKDGIVYLLSPLTDAVTDNIIVRKIISIVTGTDIDTAAQGLAYLNAHDSFSHWLSYIVNADLYLKGYGMGSSYIAEIYFAFGLPGTVLFGLFLGFFIRKIGRLNLSGGKIYRNAAIMFAGYHLFMLPRGSVFAAATDFLYFIAAVIIVKVIYMAVYSKPDPKFAGAGRERVR